MEGLVTHCFDSRQDQTLALKIGACSVPASTFGRLQAPELLLNS